MLVKLNPQKRVVEIEPDYWRALKRLTAKTGIPMNVAVHKAIKDFVNYYEVHITKERKGD